MRILTNISKAELEYLTSQPTANAIAQQISMLNMQLIQLQKVNSESSSV